MGIMKKLSILAQAAKYDRVCGKDNKGAIKAGTSNDINNFIFYSPCNGGGYVPLLKVLFTNICINDCKYCYNIRSNDIERAIFKPAELAKLTYELYRKGQIKGLFLSSGIYKNPDYTMELMISTAKILRGIFGFDGYIHLKIIPGTSPDLIKVAMSLATRVSCNIELPTEESLKLLAPDKTVRDITSALKSVRYNALEHNINISTTTQLIIGATPESDATILKLANTLYSDNLAKRVYYSAYIPVNPGVLPDVTNPPLLREHRLYQADWLIRFYGFKVEDIFQGTENLSNEMDPKMLWALRNMHIFPIDVKRAPYDRLILVPGIGPKTAKKIIKVRREGYLDEQGLKRIGISLTRAREFITIGGKPLPQEQPSNEKLKNKFSSRTRQLALF